MHCTRPWFLCFSHFLLLFFHRTTRSKKAGRLDPERSTREANLFLAQERQRKEERTLAHVDLKRDRIELARAFEEKRELLLAIEEDVERARKEFRQEKLAGFEARVADYQDKLAAAAAKQDAAEGALAEHEAAQHTAPGGANAAGNPGADPGGRSIPRNAHAQPPARRTAGDTLNPTHLAQDKQLPGGAKLSMEELNRRALSRSDFVKWKMDDELWQVRRQRKQAAQEMAHLEEHIRKIELRISERVRDLEAQQVGNAAEREAYRAKWKGEARTRKEREKGRHDDATQRLAAQQGEVDAKAADTAGKQAELDGYAPTWRHGSVLVNPDGSLTDRYESNEAFDEFAVGAGADGTAFSPFTGGGSGGDLAGGDPNHGL